MGTRSIRRFGEAPLDAAEARDRLADRIVGNPQFVRDRDRGGGVEPIVPPCHRQHETGISCATSVLRSANTT